MTSQDLKNSILQYAIQGKLVPQNPTHEPASELLKRIKAEKEQLILEKKIKKEKPLQAITEDEIPFEIPDSWVWVKMNEITNIYTGNSINETEKLSKFTNHTKGYNYIATKDVEFNNSINYQNGIKIPFDNNTFRIAYTNSILMCIEGGSAGRKIGYLKENVCFGNKLCSFNAIGFNSLYLYYFLQNPLFLDVFRTNTSGIIGGVSINKLKELLIPLPPLAEQQLIVEKIEELMPMVEEYGKAELELRELNKAFPEQIKKSVLQYAVQGKLVSQNPQDESANILLDKIKAEKQQLIKDKVIKASKPLAPITEEEIPFEIPDSWVWVRLGDVVQINPRNNIENDLNVSFIPMTLINSGFQNQHTSVVKKWNEIKSGFTHFAEGDIGIAKITPCFENRKSVIFKNLSSGYGAGTTELHILRTYLETINKDYLLLFCKTEMFIMNGVKTYTGTAGQQRIGKDYVANCLFPLPPLSEQKRIVEKVEEVLGICEKLKG